jgi:hypothetical protein
MLNKLAFALILVPIVTATALGTQFVLSAHAARVVVADSTKSDRLVPNECKTATWPDIPQSCLQRIEFASPLRTIVLNAPK